VRVRSAIASLALALLLALPGCGGGDGATETTGAEPHSREPRARPEPAAKPPAQSGTQGKGTSSQGPQEPAPTSSAPLPNEGTKAVAPGVPTVRGGDNSIQEYGVEGSSAGRAQAARTLQAFFRAQAAGGWSRACSYLSAATKRELEETVARSPESDESKPKGCREILRVVGALTRPGDGRSAAEIRVLSMRVEGKQAYLLYKDSEGTRSAIAMDREGGRWLVGNLSAAPLVLGPGPAR